MVGAVRRSAVLNTRHSVRSVLHLLAVVCEVARGRTGSRKIPTSINVANEDSVTGVTQLGVQHARSRRDGVLGIGFERSPASIPNIV